MDELKEAYFKMAKLYHPDSQSTTADSKKFDQIKQAYKTIKRRIEEMNHLTHLVEEDDENDVFDFRAPKPQHRQFLDNEGFGYGSASQRQKQYKQFRVNRAQEKVLKYKLEKMMPTENNALLVKDQKAAKKTKMSNTIERLVEDMIQESMMRGDFDNLSGAGKPLDHSKDNPYMDKITQKLNQILINDGVQPDWIMKQKEIRTELQKCRETLAVELRRNKVSDTSSRTSKDLDQYVEAFRISLLDVNDKINQYNLVVPILNKQMVPYSFDREYQKVCSNVDEYLPRDYDAQLRNRSASLFDDYGSKSGKSVSLRDVLREIKALFTNR